MKSWHFWKHSIILIIYLFPNQKVPVWWVLFQSSRKLVGLYRKFSLVIFQILPDQQLLCQTIYCDTWLSKIWQPHEKRDKKWVIKTVSINDLRFYMRFCTKYGCYDRVFHQTPTFSVSICILEPKFCQTFGLVVFNLSDRHRLYQSGPVGFGKDCWLPHKITARNVTVRWIIPQIMIFNAAASIGYWTGKSLSIIGKPWPIDYR